MAIYFFMVQLRNSQDYCTFKGTFGMFGLKHKHLDKVRDELHKFILGKKEITVMNRM